MQNTDVVKSLMTFLKDHEGLPLGIAILFMRSNYETEEIEEAIKYCVEKGLIKKDKSEYRLSEPKEIVNEMVRK